MFITSTDNESAHVFKRLGFQKNLFLEMYSLLYLIVRRMMEFDGGRM